jgi:hypothetical protein
MKLASANRHHTGTDTHQSSRTAGSVSRDGANRRPAATNATSQNPNNIPN